MKLTLGSAAPLIDDPLPLLVEGCAPGERVALVARSEIMGALFEARATFEADGGGRVDPRVQPSLEGSYTGADPFGLCWSAQPVGPSTAVPMAPVACRVVATSASDEVEAVVPRRWLAEGTTARPVAEAGVHGLYAVPAGPGPFPVVVAFGGSSGGLGPAAAWAPLLASRGFATLAVAYFAGPGLPDELVEIEIETVERALAWLARRPEVRSGPVTVMGQSRGSELALWAAALVDGVGAAVVFAASGVSWSGLGRRGPVDRPAWTFRGQPLPHAGLGSSPVSGMPVELAGLFREAMRNLDAIRAAEIPVERSRGPILAVSGEDDAMWPSAELTEIAARRAGPHGFTHLRYPAAGHVAGGPTGMPISLEVRSHPLDGGRYAFGGTRAGNAAARADSWPRVLAFLAAR